MKAPKCRLCGHEHWSHEAHVFKESGSGEPRKAEKAKVDPIRDVGPPIESGARQNEAHSGQVGKRSDSGKGFDRREYQRQYMKWVRAGRKGKFVYENLQEL